MTMFVGETVTIKVAAQNPIDGLPITDATVTVLFYVPGLLPAFNLADRTPTGVALSLMWSATAIGPKGALGAYVGNKLTAGMAPGKWSYRAHIGGLVYDSWEYGTFVLKA